MKTLLAISLFFIPNLIFSQNYVKLDPKKLATMRNERSTSDEYDAKLLGREISKDSLSKIKAVLIIGAGCDSPGFNLESVNIEKKLSEFNIKLDIIKPDLSLDKIKEKTKGANILIYIGHGGESNGLYINKKSILPIDFKSLELAKNHIVILGHACYSAGSSQTDGSKDIGFNEAFRRVSNYSKGFTNNGAGLYLALNTNNGIPDFLYLFLRGLSLEDIMKDDIAKKYVNAHDSEVQKRAQEKYNITVTKKYDYDYDYGFAYVSLENYKVYNLLK